MTAAMSDPGNKHGTLTRVIPPQPARTVTQEVLWCKRDFMEVERHNGFRRKANLSEAKQCWWCNKPYVPGDMLALIGRPGKVNVLICQECAAEVSNA
jgi:hypothetical protein